MKLVLAFALLAAASVVSSENRQKRQTQQPYYPSTQSQAAQTQSPRYAQAQYQQQAQAVSQYQQGQQPQYNQQYDYQQQQPAQPARRVVQGSRQAAPAGGRKAVSSQNSQATSQEEEDEEDNKPSLLELLLERSTFKCDGKKDGYYADTSVECKAFHYCIGGARNSFMCAEGTVFHQVHLNCVPADQDICGSSEKYYFVNDYLNKELDERGPNNTILYADRYYPEGFITGDPFPDTPQPGYAPRSPAVAPQQYEDEPAPRQRPAARATQRAAAPAGVTYRQAAAQPVAQPAYRQPAPVAQAAPAYRQAASPNAATYRQAQPSQSQTPQAYDPYAQYRGGQQQQAAAGQNPYYRSAAASNPQAQYQYEDQSSEERGVKYDDE